VLVTVRQHAPAVHVPPLQPLYGMPSFGLQMRGERTFAAGTGYDLVTGLGSPACGLLAAVAPAPTPAVTVSMTETSFGPRICINGTGFRPALDIEEDYDGIPSRTASLAGSFTATSDGKGAFTIRETTVGTYQLAICTTTRIQGNVTITVIAEDSGDNIIQTVVATIPTFEVAWLACP